MMKYDVLTLSSSSASDFSAGGSESFNGDDDEDTKDDFTQLLVSDDNPCQESTCHTCIGTRTHLFWAMFAMIILATTCAMSTHQQCKNRDGVQVDILPTADQRLPPKSELPDIAWLMSFPNSGTSYTLRLVQAVSNTTAATNYAEECMQDSSGNVATLYDSPSGPYLRQQAASLPKAYIPTKTHCGGRCVHCIPEKYVVDANTFHEQCLTGTLTGPPVINEFSNHMNAKDSLMNRTHVHYSADSAARVRKAIHLIRDPFNNIVARFHLEYNNHKAGSSNFTVQFPNNATGFRSWCDDLDRQYHRKENKTKLIPSEIKAYFDAVPCHSEFFRWAQWHNMALEVLEKLVIPSYTLYYESYEESSFELTLTGILHFLELERVGKASPFIAGKAYHGYYTKSELMASMKLIKAVSTPEAWSLVQRYKPNK